MSPAGPAGAPRLARFLVSIAARLVPRRARDEWRREWEAELTARWSTVSRWEQQSGAAGRQVRRHAAGALLDALWLRAQATREGLILDARHAARRLLREPMYAGFVVLLMTLGIGANTVLCSLVEGVLIRPPAYPEPARLVQAWETNASLSVEQEGVSPGDFQHWREHASGFDGIAAWYTATFTLQEGTPSQMYPAAQVSNDFFRVLGVRPAIGREFTDEEVDRSVFSSSNTHVGEGPVVMLSDRIWRARFGADPAVVGRKLRIDRKEWLVTGVMPSGFDYPSAETDLWVPMSFAKPRPRDQRYMSVIGRLAPGVSREDAEARLRAVAGDMELRFPESNRGWSARLTSLEDEMVASVRGALLALLAAVGCVLLVVGLNIAGLQTARAGAREREIGIRAALGAPRSRLVRQHLIETLLLAGAGGALGVLGARWGLDAVKAAAPAMPRVHEVTLNGAVLALSIAVTLLTGVLVGLGPALGATSGDPAAIVKDGGPATSSKARLRSRRLLVAAEIAVTVVLLTSSGLLLKSYLRLRGVDPGFKAEGVLVLPIALDGKAYAKGAGPYYLRLQEKLEAIPGVTAAGGATYLPGATVGPDFFRPVWADGARPAAGEEPLADVRIATPSYFATLGIPMKRGRGFDGRDNADAQRVIVVNESLARRIWPGGDAVGRRLIIDYSTSGTYDYEVVGVAGDVRAYGLRSLPRPELYIPHPQRTYLMMNMAVKVAGDPAAFVEPIRKAVLEIDPLQPVHSISLLPDLLGRSVQRDRLVTTLMALFSSSALALAVLGLYGVVSYQVSRRTREIGIRIALGARSSDVRWTILSQEAPLLAAGLASGFAASAALTGLVQAQLYEVSASDPATFVAVGAALTLALLAAVHGPSRRASRIDPLEVLKRS